MKCLWLVSLILWAPHAMSAIVIPPGGEELRSDVALQANASPSVGKVTPLEQGKRITITSPDAARAYAAQFTAPVPVGLAKQEIALVIIKARVVGDEQTGEVQAKLQLNSPPYTSFGASISVGIHREWTEQPVVFVTESEVPANKAAVALLCGHQKQSIEVASIRVLRYPKGTDVSTFPRAKLIKRTYPGREADAPWRKEALERIEKHRKAELSLTLTGSDGLPLPSTEVKLRLRRHEFGFGSAVVAKRFSSESEDDRRYREIVDRLFSIVVFENDLKDGDWSPEKDEKSKAQRNAALDKAFSWLAERNIAVRGHYLMQVATPFNLTNIKDTTVIKNRTLESVTERLDFVKDRVIEWDVINHPIAWNGADMLNKRAGLEDLDREVFKLARSKTALPFFVNEDQVFRPGPQCDDTYTYIEKLKGDGFEVAGLGNQAHFDESYLPSPEHLLAVTDRFAKIVPRQSITEYDIVTVEDEELAADYTRDVLISVFSHPAYSSFLLWGFWEGSHWKPEAASWSKDWTVRKRGEVLEEWIGKKWHTEVTLRTDANGKATWRGFPGVYEVAVAGGIETVVVPKSKPSVSLRLE